MRKRSFGKYVLLLALVCGAISLSTTLQALNPALTVNQYNLDVFTTEDGLPQSSVLCMAQTEDGYIWLGTYEGIARFDGIRFKIFDTTTTPKIKSNRIKTMLVDHQGDLWIGTSVGLLNYHAGRFENITTTQGLSSHFILSLYEDIRGRLWIGTTNGLNCLENGNIKVYGKESGLGSTFITSLTGDGTGTIWIGTSGGGLYIFENETITPRTIDGLPANLDVRTLYRDPQGQIWIGTRGKGLAVYDGDTSDVYCDRDGLLGCDIRAISQDSDGTLWIGTNGQGLYTFKNGIFTSSSSSLGYFNSPIRTFLEDREGSFWVGTRDGLLQLSEGKFILYNKRSGLPVDNVRTVLQDNNNDIWLGTVSGGLVRFDGKTFKWWGKKEGLRSAHIWTMAQGKEGAIWIGTYGGGVHRLKNERIDRYYTTANGLSNDVIRAVAVDPRGSVWVGTNGGGVDIIDPVRNTIKNVNDKNGLSDNYIYAISVDKGGTVWVGTFYGNLNRFHNGRITVYDLGKELEGIAIWSIYPDPHQKDVLWLGTDGGGLVRFENGAVTRFTTHDGLYSDQAFQVLEDSRGNLWMNDNRGITSVSKADLKSFMADHIKRIPHIAYGRGQGIKSTECPGPAQPAGLCAKDGTLWFPTTRGAVVIDPANIKTNGTPPLVVIDELCVDGNAVYRYPAPDSSTIGLTPGSRRIEFKYTALSFISSAQVTYKYRLLGFDDRWMDAGHNRNVSYTNIEPGDYRFIVKAANNDGIWSETGANIRFTLHPYFWQTWWFQLAALVAFAVFSYKIIGFIKSHLKLIAFWKTKKHIGSYEIEEEIGSGGMGVIYKVRSLMDTTRTFAMKVMRDKFLEDEIHQQRFKNEAALIDKVDHPNIVKVQERGEDNGQLYIVMELLEGRTLAERYSANYYPTVSQAIHIMSQISHLLVHLHRNNVIHRDVKPENIMLIKRGDDPDFVKLLDFGIAREQNLPHLTETGQVLGTIAYLPPEVVKNGTFSEAVDIYSLGVIGYEMLTRKQPFREEKLLDTMREIMTGEPTEPMKINPEVPEQLNRLIMDMTAKEPVNRPDARAVLAMLASLRQYH